MWCTYCKQEIVDCTCPDIEQRLSGLLGGPGETAALQNLNARRVRRALEQDDEEQLLEATTGSWHRGH